MPNIKNNKYISFIFCLALTVSLLIYVMNGLIIGVANAESNITLKPSKPSVAQNEEFLVQVISSSSSGINAAQIYLTYDASAFRYVDFTTGALSGEVSQGRKIENGKLSFAVYNIDPIKGSDIVLINIRMAGIGGTGNISLQEGTMALNAGTVVGTGSGSVEVRIDPNAQPQSGPASPSTNQSSSPETQPQASRDGSTDPQIVNTPEQKAIAKLSDSTPPKIVSIKPSGFLDDNISFKVVTDEPTVGTLTSGPDANNLIIDSRSSGSYKKVYFISLGKLSKIIEDGKPFYYKLNVEDPAGNTTSSEISSFSTKGVTIILKVQKANSSVLANTKIIVNGKEFKTDSSGKVKIEKIIPGAVNISVFNEDGKEFALEELTAVEGVSDQELVVSIPEVAGQIIAGGETPTTQSSIRYIAIFLALLAIIIALQLFRRNRLHHKELIAHTTNPYNSSFSLPPSTKPTLPTNNQPAQAPSPLTDNQPSNLNILQANSPAPTPTTTPAPQQPSPPAQSNDSENSPLAQPQPAPDNKTNASQNSIDPMQASIDKAKIIVGDATDDD